MKNTLNIILAIISVGCLSQKAVADCTSTGSNINSYFTNVFVKVKPSDPVGKILATIPRTSISGGPISHVCSAGFLIGGGTIMPEGRTALTVAGLPYVYATNIPGIGFRIKIDSRDINYSLPTVARTAGSYSPNGNAVNSKQSSSSMQLIEIVKIESTTGSGYLTPGPIADYWIYAMNSNYNQVRPDAYQQAIIGSIYVGSSQCIVLNSPTIKLPQISKTAFTGVGSVKGGTPFNLNFTCSKDEEVLDAVTASISFNFESFSSDPSIIANTAAGSKADGIATQLIINVDGTDRVVNNGESYHLANINSTTVTTSLNMKAQYVQTDVNTTSGDVYGAATMNIEYL